MNSKQTLPILLVALLVACGQTASAQVKLSGGPHAGYTTRPLWRYQQARTVLGGSMYLDAGLAWDAGISFDYFVVDLSEYDRAIRDDEITIYHLSFMLKRDLAPERWKVQPYVGAGVLVDGWSVSSRTDTGGRFMLGMRVRTRHVQPFVQVESSFNMGPIPRLSAVGGLRFRLL